MQPTYNSAILPLSYHSLPPSYFPIAPCFIALTSLKKKNMAHAHKHSHIKRMSSKRNIYYLGIDFTLFYDILSAGYINVRSMYQQYKSSPYEIRILSDKIGIYRSNKQLTASSDQRWIVNSAILAVNQSALIGA